MLNGNWKGIPTAFIALTLGAAFCTYVIVDNIATRMDRENERVRLETLQKTDPQTYLQEIKKTDPVKWEAEFKRIDKKGYEKFNTDRRTKRVAEDQVRTQKLLAELKVTPPPSREQQVKIYRDLIQLNPTNDDYTRKYWTIRNQLSREREEQEHPLHFVAVRNLSWNSYDFHGVLEISGSIFNDLPWSVKDLTLSCTMTAQSGTILDLASGTLYERVGAKSEIKIKKFNMGFTHPQGRLSGCSIINMTVER